MIINNNRGYYEIGTPYDMTKKMEVLSIFLRLQGGDAGKIQVNTVTEEARVSVGHTHKVIMEYLVAGSIVSPKQSTRKLALTRREYSKISPEESIYLLALRAEDDRQELGTSTIDVFFKRLNIRVACAKPRWFHSISGKRKTSRLFPSLLPPWSAFPTISNTIGSTRSH
jgi:hypothetical protein